MNSRVTILSLPFSVRPQLIFLSRPTFRYKVVAMASSSAVEQDQLPSLEDQDESVRIAVKALGDMRNSRPQPSSSNSIRVYNLPHYSSKRPVSTIAYHFHKNPFLHRSSWKLHLRLRRYRKPTHLTTSTLPISSPVYRQSLS